MLLLGALSVDNTAVELKESPVYMVHINTFAAIL